MVQAGEFPSLAGPSLALPCPPPLCIRLGLASYGKHDGGGTHMLAVADLLPSV